MEVKPSVCVSPTTTINAVSDVSISFPLVTVAAKGSVITGATYVSTTDPGNCIFTFSLWTGTYPGTAYVGTWLAIDSATGDITVDDETVDSESIYVFINGDSGRYQEQTGSFTVSV
jgi:hypothetical protein